MDDRQPVFHRDVERAHDLLDRQRIPGAALDGGIVGADRSLRGPRRCRCRTMRARRRRFAVIGHVGGERGQFEERRAGVEQLLDAARAAASCPAAPAARDRAAAARARAASCFARNSRGERAIVRVVGAEFRRSTCDHRGDASAHRLRPCPAASSSATISSLSKVSPTPRVQLGDDAVARRDAASICNFMLSIVDERLAARDRVARPLVNFDHAAGHRRAHVVVTAPPLPRLRRADRRALTSKRASVEAQIWPVPDMRAGEAQLRRPSISNRLPAVAAARRRRHLVFATVDRSTQTRAPARRSPRRAATPSELRS